MARVYDEAKILLLVFNHHKKLKTIFFFRKICIKRVFGSQHRSEHFCSWHPGTKNFPESKNTFQIQNASSSGTCLWILGSVFGFWEVFLDSGTCFGFWEVFWILGRVFGFWEVFWILGRVFGFWDVFWILGRVFGFWDVFLDSGKCFWIMGRVLDSRKCFGFWDVFCPYKPRIDVIWKQTNNNKLECLRIQQWVISSIQYFSVQVITLSLYSLFFQPYFFKFCEFYSGMALYDVYDEVGDFPFKGHICAWMKNET